MSITIKRLLAFIIDLIFIFAITAIINNIFRIDKNFRINNNQELKELATLSEQYLKDEVTYSYYFDTYMDINYQIDKNNVIYKIVEILVILFYFVLVPIFTKGKTCGLRILNLKINKYDLKTLIIRNIFTTGLFTMLLMVIFLIFNYKIYFISTFLISFIQVLLVIISSFMIIYRKDKRGLQDIFSRSKIVEVK